MINIKRYIDRVSAQDNKQGRDVVLPIAEARVLRDEIVKLIADKYIESESRAEEPVTVEVKGGTW
jgi:hypothetical protein